jgi:hypothetical protein
MASRRRHERDDVVGHLVTDVEGAYGVLKPPDPVRREHLGHVVERLAPLDVASSDPGLASRIRIADAQADEEPVELRLGQRERPLVLDRVLGREHDERLGEWSGDALERNLALLHRLEEGGLRSRRCPVDLVDQHDVVEHGSRQEAKRAAIEDARPGDVGGEQIGRPLDPGERQPERPRERPGKERLAHAGNVLDEGMPVGEKGDQQQAQRCLGADDRRRDRLADRVPGPDAVPGGVDLDAVVRVQRGLDRRHGTSRRPGSSAAFPFDGTRARRGRFAADPALDGLESSLGARRERVRVAQSPAMAGRDPLTRADPAISLPAFERLATPPPPEFVGAAIEGHSAPGDVVVDLHGRGGWVARAAVDRQRRAITIESNPLTRLLAEIVLRPPDVRHLDAAFQAIAAAPRQESSLKVSIGDLFATKCATCGRTAVADEFIWEAGDAADEAAETPIAGAAEADRGGPDEAIAGDAGQSGSDWASHAPPEHPHGHLVRKHYRCLVCRDQLGGGEQRHAAVDPDDLTRAGAAPSRGAAWRLLHERFPTLDGHDMLVDQLLDLHTPRQLEGLHAILQRIDADLRSASVEAALRLSLLHALLPASRLNGFPGRIANLRIHAGRVRLPSGEQWRERNPWLAFEDGYRLVRGFVQRLEGSAHGPLPARFGDDVRSLGEGVASAVVRLGTPAAYRSLELEARDVAGTSGGRPRVRLVLGQPPQRPNQDRLSFTYLATAWLLGREAAALLPLESLFGSGGRAPWGWQAAALRRSLGSVEPWLARDARVVLLLEAGGPEALVAAVLGGVSAGYRIAAARLAEPGEEIGGIVELVPPGATVAPGPRTRSNQSLDHVLGGAGDPDLVPGRGLFAPPERFDARPYSPSEAARTVTETAVEILQARGEPARHERLVGEILVGLDRAGVLRRLISRGASGAGDMAGGGGTAASDGDVGVEAGGPREDRRHPSGSDREDTGRTPGRDLRDRQSARPAAGWRTDPAETTEPGLHAEPVETPSPRAAMARPRRDERREPATLASNDQVETVLTLVRDELARPDQRRLREIEPGRWWLADPRDVDGAALPLADRVEWAVFSLLSTAGRLSETSFFERVAGLFGGHDLPDEALVRACLASYRSLASTPDRLVTADDLLRRSQEHTELLALLADQGHRLGFKIWLGAREQSRKLGGRRLGDWLDDRESSIYLPLISHGPVEDVEQVDCIWYVRSRGAFMFEVEWTAMLGEPLLRRHAHTPNDENLVRFLVIAPERTELVRYKLERSPLLRQAMDAGNWHILKANHLRTWAARDELSIDDLEPLLGLDPLVERSSEQLPLFGVPPAGSAPN